MNLINLNTFLVCFLFLYIGGDLCRSTSKSSDKPFFRTALDPEFQLGSVILKDEQVDPKDVERQDTVSDFSQFYSLFREAVLKNDSTFLKQLTHFPLEVWGYEDNDPRIKLTRFDWSFFEQAMSAYIGLDPNTQEQRSTLEFFRQVKDIKQHKNYIPNNTEQQLGNLVFTRVKGEWKLTIIFANTKG